MPASTGSPPLRARTNITSRDWLSAAGNFLPRSIRRMAMPSPPVCCSGGMAELVVGHGRDVDKCACHGPPTTRGHAEADGEGSHRTWDRVRRHLEAVHQQAGRRCQLRDVHRPVATRAPRRGAGGDDRRRYRRDARGPDRVPCGHADAQRSSRRRSASGRTCERSPRRCSGSCHPAGCRSATGRRT